jgi:hypothetical protein
VGPGCRVVIGRAAIGYDDRDRSRTDDADRHRHARRRFRDSQRLHDHAGAGGGAELGRRSDRQRQIQRTAFNRSPKAIDNAYTTSEDVDLTGNVLTDETDDVDADGDDLSATLVTGPAHGDVVLNPDGSFTYTPDADYHGTDTFNYRASDEGGWHLHGFFGLFGGGHSDIATVTITVNPVEDDVVARDDSSTTTGTTPVSGNSLTNDIAENPDGPAEMLTVTSGGTFQTTGGGTVAMQSNGIYSYTAAAGFTGVDTFEYTVSDGSTSDVGEVSITVTSDAANTPPVAGFDSLATAADTQLDFDAADLLINDFDADGDDKSVVVTGNPSSGTLVDNQDGTFTYVPNAGFVGTDKFYYAVTDRTDQSLDAAVTIIVGGPANTPPVANTDSLSTTVGTPLTIAAQDLVGNDIDADGDGLTAFTVSEPDHGTLGFDPETGAFIYTPDAGYTGSDTFYCVAYDGAADSVPTSVTITVVDAANVAPIAVDDDLSTPADTPLTIAPEDCWAMTRTRTGTRRS